VWSLAGAAAAADRTAHVHVFAGEYEGYAAYARAAGLTVVTHDRGAWDDDGASDRAFDARAMHRWYVSQPSAIDGNMWRELPEFIRVMDRRGVDVAVDLAYVGAVADQPVIDVSSPNVPHVFFSLSKVFGVFYHRVGGVLSRAPLLGLEGNKWFKNMFSLYLGTSLIQETPTPMTLPAKYRPVQAEACRVLREQHGIPLAPSDVMLLASSPPGEYPAAFRRGAGYRWCLTPTLDRLLRSNKGTAAHA
jgi:histidinol-phosphate/aromatic aminotransferase/cobyric acid decarboxylase-like protein